MGDSGVFGRHLWLAPRPDAASPTKRDDGRAVEPKASVRGFGNGVAGAPAAGHCICDSIPEIEVRHPPTNACC